MSDPLERGRALEAQGDVDGAAKAYIAARAASDAARVLAMRGRLEDAAHAILEALGVEASGVGALPAKERELAKQAAAFFKSFRPELAQQIHDALAAAGPPPAAPDRPTDQSATASSVAKEAAPSRSAPSSSLRAPSSGLRPPTASGSFRAPQRPPGGPPEERAGAPSATSTQGGLRRPIVGSAELIESLRTPSADSAARSGSLRSPMRMDGGSVRVPSGMRAPGPPPSIEDVPREPTAPRAPTGDAPQRPVITSDPTPERAARPVITSDPIGERAARPVITSDPIGERPARPVITSDPVGERAARPVITSDPIHPQRTVPAARSVTPTSEVAKAARATPTPRDDARLSASGEKVTEYAGSRADGWRDADAAAIERSIQEHVQAGRKGAAARIARDAGQLERALAWFMELGIHYQAGGCLRELGRFEEARVELLLVETDSPSYRKACFELVEVSRELERLDFDADRFLTAFVDEGPADASEIDAYIDLGNLYAKAGFASGARRCAQKVLALDPSHAEAKQLAPDTTVVASARVERRRRQFTFAGAELPALPSLEEFIALAKEHAP
ncbi:MAG: hypothetical protein AB7S26_26485 [Sandaracinaceae bacterium]